MSKELPPVNKNLQIQERSQGLESVTGLASQTSNDRWHQIEIYLAKGAITRRRQRFAALRGARSIVFSI